MQNIETDLEERRAQSLKSARLKAGSSTVHSSSFISDPEQDGLDNFSRLDGSCSRSMVYMIGEDESQRSQININPSFVTNIKICSPRYLTHLITFTLTRLLPYLLACILTFLIIFQLTCSFTWFLNS